MKKTNPFLSSVRPLCFLLLAGLLHAEGAPPPPPDGYEWNTNPSFSDEFNGTELDGKKWYNHHPRWRGRAPAMFVSENVSVQDGNLRLTNGMLDHPHGDFTIGGAAVVSKSKEALYGYYECRMKASSISMSSTFWLSGGSKHIPDVGRVGQELDIQETVGGTKNNQKFRNAMNSNTHVWHNGESNSKGNHAALSPPTDETFHTYGCWWENASTVHFYCNDQHVGTVTPSTIYAETPFDHPMQLNMVTETYDWETPPTPEEVNNQAINTTLIDWVRAYTLEPDENTKLQLLFKEPRTWTYGRHKVKGTLQRVSLSYAYITKENGKEFKKRIKELCEEDQALLKKAAELK